LIYSAYKSSSLPSGYINIGTLDFTNTVNPSIVYLGVSFNVDPNNNMFHGVFKGSST
jgi:hypothetical protein